MGVFTRHRADPGGPPIELGPLTVVCDGGDWLIALEEYPAFYTHMRDDDDADPGEADPGDNADWCMDCNVYFDAGEDTGRTYCGCGFWYDRYFWNI